VTQTQVFDILRQLMTSEDLNKDARDAISQETMSHLEDLIGIDPEATSALMVQAFSTTNALVHEQVLNRLSEHPKLQFQYLSAVFRL
jgi:hypothetical protein